MGTTQRHPLERCFLPLDQRTPPGPCFFRVIGRDAQGVTERHLTKFQQMASSGGLCLQDGLDNPSEPEISRFYQVVGESWAAPGLPLAERHMTMWLGQLRPEQRKALAAALMGVVELLRSQGTNETVVRNAYIKFMCWFRDPLGHLLTGIGRAMPPCVLFQGEISKYEMLLLHLLHRAGCDVVYVNFRSEEPYQKADRGGRFSELIRGELLTPPPASSAGGPAPKPGRNPPPAPSPARPPSPAGPPPWAGMEDTISLNGWAEGQAVWETVLLPNAKRTRGGSQKIHSLFAACFGADERGEYRNRLFRLKRALDGAGGKWLLLDQKPPAPTAAETAPFQSVDKSQSRSAVTAGLAARLTPACGRVQALLAQRAFALVMERLPEQDPVRVYNYGVRLACWIRRYTELLFEGYRPERQPVLLCYGPQAASGAALLWAMAQTGADVLYFSPDLDQRRVFADLFLPPVWTEVLFDNSLPAEPFPQREEKLRAGTTAYRASKELDRLLYSDTGMFRDRQFARSQPVTLKTTYDEVGQLWKEEAQFRPSFRTESGVVYVPNLFSKISGVDKGDLELYWDRIRAMVGENTYLADKVPFLQVNGPSMSTAQAAAFLHGGRLDPKALKESRFYRYDYMPDDTQDYILEKIQALIDYDLILDGGPDLPSSMLSVLMNLDKELLRLIQNFDFTREIPKFLIVDVTETMFTLEECILLAFLNLVGFDIAVFTPTGYRNLEKHLRPDSYDTLIAGEFRFDLTVPDLRARRKAGGDWFNRLFGLNR